MYVISLKYTASPERINEAIPAHREFLKKYYDEQYFLLSGPKDPRDGGIIIAKKGNRAQMEAIIAEDPFKQQDLAEYEIMEFTPAFHAAGLEKYL